MAHATGRSELPSRAAMAAPSPQPPKRNWWPVEIPGVIGSTQRIGLWVGSRPSQAGASIGAEPIG